MEGKDTSAKEHKNGSVTINLCKQIDNVLVWQENITNINLSSRSIETLDDKLKFPRNLLQLNLSHNKLAEVPCVVINLEQLVLLNLSHNAINYFDNRPKFCHSLKQLDMSYNHLLGPPYWIWTEQPQNLTQLYLSNNPCITNSFVNGYFEDLMQYSTLVTQVNLQNCKLSKFAKLLTTFPNAESICLGSADFGCNANSLIEIPCEGLNKCCDLKRLIVCNTHIYTVNASIEKYKNIVELNLAFNELNGLPDEFCKLENLETCVLSCNKLLYLPDDIHKLKKLVKLYLDDNELCMLPYMLSELSNLKVLDLYDNYLNEMPNISCNLEELDLARNYFEEPEDSEYIEKKEKLRLVHERRYDGRKIEIYRSDNNYDEKSSEDDEELYDIIHNGPTIEEPPLKFDPPSSPEDWDSDEYWVPFDQRSAIPSAQTPWMSFIKQKMKDGNFCPMDIHPVSIVDTIRYKKLFDLQLNYESEGQFDDYSSDES